MDTHPSVMALLSTAEAEEDHHALLCAQMAKAMGHPIGFAHRPSSEAVPAPSWHRLADERRVLLDVVLMCCVTESLNASLLNSIYAEAKPTEARSLIRQILQDEVKHAQIGWAYLETVAQHTSCAVVADYLSEMLDLAVRDELFMPLTDIDEIACYDAGVMPVKDRLIQFELTLETVIIPGFENFGIDTQGISAWLDRQLACST